MQEQKKRGLRRLLYDEPPLFMTHTVTELVGNRRISLEGLLDILQFTTEEIRLKTRDGIVRICGENLTITALTQDSIELRGTILMLILAENGEEIRHD